MSDLDALRRYLRHLGRVCLGYSGGVDSALLAVVGRQALGPEAFLAVIGRSASYPEVQYRSAVDLAARFDVPLLEVDTAELADPSYLANPTNRCYFCKSELWSVLRRTATERGFDTIIDGTNRDDLGEHRPGLAAAAELRVHSPLAELGWSKDDVREAARALGLPTWDAPASPCLSSRIQYGLPVTRERLQQVERGEEYLRGLGVTGDLRVRHQGESVRIETGPGGQAIIRARWPEVARFFETIGIHHVNVDPRGYRRGSLLAVVPGPA
jgi:uncharacterized protein